MANIITLSFFHRKIGPIIFYSYPENILDDNLSLKVTTIMDQPTDDSFFLHTFGGIYTINYYFEIDSSWSRGKKEMIMVSILYYNKIRSKVEESIFNLFHKFSKMLEEDKDVFMAFYIDDGYIGKEDVISKKNLLIKSWLRDLYWSINDEIRIKSEEEKIAFLLFKKHIHQTIRKLSKVPIRVEELRSWFKKKFDNIDFDETLETLISHQFIFVNQIGGVEKYVLLLKDTNIERIPPNNIIDYIDKLPEIISTLLPKIQDFFDHYKIKNKHKDESHMLFKIIADQRIYSIFLELRNNIYRSSELRDLIPTNSQIFYVEIITRLKFNQIIEEIIYREEKYIVMKTNIRIKTSFPKYLKKILDIDIKPIIAKVYIPPQKVMTAKIFSNIRD